MQESIGGLLLRVANERMWDYMITVKCTYANRDSVTTGFNGTFHDAERYFMNQVFNLGTVEDNMQECIKIEPVRKTWDELCKDFEARKPHGEPVAYTSFFNMKWENGNDSVNDLLCRGLQELGYTEKIHTFNGDVWFLYHDVWERCIHEVKDNVVHFYMCKFED